MPKAGRLVFVIFLGVGAVMLAVAVFTYLHTRTFIAGAAMADGVVIENVWSSSSSSRSSGTYHPRVRFRANGREFVFVSSVGSSPASFRVNDAVQVYYNPENPDNARINSFGELWLLPLIFGSLGVVFSLVGIGPFVWQRHVRQRDDWLRANGRRIYADFDRVEVNTSLRVNGRCPWRIVCQWLDPASNQVHVFHSHNLWYDPAKYITGKTLEVLVAPDNPKRYLVETSFLPKLAE
jgi:hypothetical protein